MSVQHTAPNSLAGSQSNLSEFEDDSVNRVAVRKRKTPYELVEFKDEINQSLGRTVIDIKNDITTSLLSFREELTTMFQDMLVQQNESIKLLSAGLVECKTQIAELQHTSQKLSGENKQIHSNLSEFKNDNLLLKSKTLQAENSIKQMEEKIADISKQLLFKEQQCRMNNLEIIGIPQTKSENLFTILCNIATKVGTSLSPADVDHIHRVRRFPLQQNTTENQYQIPNIVVRFTHRQIKMNLLSAVKARRGLTTADINVDGAARPIYLNEHLAPHNKVLFNKTRKLGMERGYTYIWVKDCKIFVRKSDSSKSVLITTEDDLAKIK